MRATLALTLLLGSLAALAVADPAPDPESDPEIAALVGELGDVRWRVRQQATERLFRHGHRALPALRRATTNADPEIATRARALRYALGDLQPERPPVDRFAPRGRIVNIVRRYGEQFVFRINPDSGRTEIEFQGKQYPVSTLPELFRRYREVVRKIQTRRFGRRRRVPEPRSQPEWPAIGVRVTPARPLGLEIGAVIPGSAAERIGLRVGDRLLRIGTRAWQRLTLEVPDMTAALDRIGLGESFTITVVREGAERVLVGMRQR